MLNIFYLFDSVEFAKQGIFYGSFSDDFSLIKVQWNILTSWKKLGNFLNSCYNIESKIKIMLFKIDCALNNFHDSLMS